MAGSPLNPKLIELLVDRQVASDLKSERHQRFLKSESPRSTSPTPLHPGLVSLLGALTDTASTYRFMKRGEHEDNAAVKGMSPEALAATGVASAIGMQGLRKLLSKKFPRAADAIAANQGALQLGYGINNLVDLRGQSSSADVYRTALIRALQQDTK
jgi:hypothetical protein